MRLDGGQRDPQHVGGLLIGAIVEIDLLHDLSRTGRELLHGLEELLDVHQVFGLLGGQEVEILFGGGLFAGEAEVAHGPQRIGMGPGVVEGGVADADVEETDGILHVGATFVEQFDKDILNDVFGDLLGRDDRLRHVDGAMEMLVEEFFDFGERHRSGCLRGQDNAFFQ